MPTKGETPDPNYAPKPAGPNYVIYAAIAVVAIVVVIFVVAAF